MALIEEEEQRDVWCINDVTNSNIVTVETVTEVRYDLRPAALSTRRVFVLLNASTRSLLVPLHVLFICPTPCVDVVGCLRYFIGERRQLSCS